MNEKTVAVIGAGNGGFATAADLALAGWNIHLFELPRFKGNIAPILEKGGIEITGAARTGFAKLAKITTDIKEAVHEVPHILITMQALAHEEIAKMLAPNVKPGQAIFLIPGSGGSLVFAKIFREKGVKDGVEISEVITLPYGSRKTSPTNVNITRMLGKNFIAAIPSKDNEKVLKRFQQFYSKVSLMSNVLEVAINNPNIILHPAATMLSIARIEFAKGDFGLYQEGFSPSVMKVLEALDQELMAIQRVLGLSVMSYKKLFELRYEKPFEEHLYGTMLKHGSRGPTDVKTRYITEDVPIGMILTASIGQQFGVPTPTYHSIIHLCGLMNGVDYWKEGRTLEKLGLSKMGVKELNQYLEG
jgi:opine dehydrogenase